MTDEMMVARCTNAALQIRKDIIEMTYATGNMGAHLGGSLSCAEILATLYVGTLDVCRDNCLDEYRDRLILSKGHAALALYPAMVCNGLIDRAELSSFKSDGSRLGGHPSLNGLPGIEFASGSLGQGLSLGVGVCLGLKKKDNYRSKCYVILGDGECDEGSVWEAAVSASNFGLDNLTAIVDVNHIQYDGETDIVMNMSPFADKWSSFGWDVISVDGHDVRALLDAYKVKTEKPKVILAHTVKGKGISFMEGNWRFHNSRLTADQYQQSLTELENRQ